MASILVIDDMKGVLQTLEVMLKAIGHEPTCVADSEVGLKYAKENKYDLIMTDIIMPEKDGIDVLMDLKNDQKDLPVIAISGGGNRVSSDDALSIARLYADNVLEKPFKRDELSEMIDKTLNKEE